MLELMKSFFTSYGYDEALKRYCQNEWKKDSTYAYLQLKDGNYPIKIKRGDN